MVGNGLAELLVGYRPSLVSLVNNVIDRLHVDLDDLRTCLHYDFKDIKFSDISGSLYEDFTAARDFMIKVAYAAFGYEAPPTGAFVYGVGSTINKSVRLFDKPRAIANKVLDVAITPLEKAAKRWNDYNRFENAKWYLALNDYTVEREDIFKDGEWIGCFRNHSGPEAGNPKVEIKDPHWGIIHGLPYFGFVVDRIKTS